MTLWSILVGEDNFTITLLPLNDLSLLTYDSLINTFIHSTNIYQAPMYARYWNKNGELKWTKDDLCLGGEAAAKHRNSYFILYHKPREGKCLVGEVKKVLPVESIPSGRKSMWEETAVWHCVLNLGKLQVKVRGNPSSTCLKHILHFSSH